MFLLCFYFGLLLFILFFQLDYLLFEFIKYLYFLRYDFILEIINSTFITINSHLITIINISIFINITIKLVLPKSKTSWMSRTHLTYLGFQSTSTLFFFFLVRSSGRSINTAVSFPIIPILLFFFDLFLKLSTQLYLCLSDSFAIQLLQIWQPPYQIVFIRILLNRKHILLHIQFS